jgi:hypothetical protein
LSLCDKDETIQHILVSYVFFTRQVWLFIIQKLGLAALAPQPAANWCHGVPKIGSKLFLRISRKRRIPSSSFCLGRYGNITMLVLFEGARPCISVVLQAVANGSNLWSLAGASALH